jgi:flagellin
MPLTVNTNVASLAAQRSMLNTNNALETSFERLASGKRINSASDDAAGMAVANSFTSNINAVNAAMANTNNGISAASIAEGALAEASEILQRMRELAVQANNNFLDTEEFSYLQAEQVALESALDDVVGAASFGDTALLSTGATFSFQSGIGSGDTSSFTTVTISASSAGGSNLTTIDLSSAANAVTAIGLLDTSIDAVNGYRADLGAAISQFESTVRNLANIEQNMSAARSRIEDTDYASETAALTKNQILQQASTSILAQANQQPQAVLALLQ